MNDNLVPIACDKCQSRFRVKPTAFKIMKTVRCTKCGYQIPLAKFADAIPTSAPATTETVPQEKAPEPAVTEVKPAPVPPPAAAPAPAPAPVIVSAPKPPPTPAPPAANPERDALLAESKVLRAERDSLKSENDLRQEKVTRLQEEINRLQEEIKSLRGKLTSLESENAESDARIASLQELWHSKELEGREMAERMAKAELAAKQAMSVRDAFMTQIKHELAVHLVKERDATMSRFAELEQKLLGIKPG